MVSYVPELESNTVFGTTDWPSVTLSGFPGGVELPKGFERPKTSDYPDSEVGL